MRPIKKLLIANRGEIACRIIKTCKAMNIPTVAVYSDADEESPHVKAANQAVRIGAPPSLSSYLNQDKILSAAKMTAADAVHPGYGFLAENHTFAAACEENGLIFVGPPASAIELMASKIKARQLVEGLNIPVVPGFHSNSASMAEFKQAANETGYPLLIKSSAGGGGIGMKTVESPDQFEEVFDSVQREAKSSFDDDAIFLEKLLPIVRHIEIQIAADQAGNTVHLFERDCSIQRRRQKVIEETPAPGISADLLGSLSQAACDIAKAVNYVGLGTVEFLVENSTEGDGPFYFLEMNTRLQVEHGVTEQVTGFDLVEMQLDIAQGASMPVKQENISRKGHSIECRIYAEDPSAGFQPVTGTLAYWRMPTIENVRVDDGVASGLEISPFYDNMLAKIVATGKNRTRAILAMADALNKAVVFGIDTNIQLLKNVIRNPQWSTGESNTQFLEAFTVDNNPPTEEVYTKSIIAAAVSYIEKSRSLKAGKNWEGNRHLTHTVHLEAAHQPLDIKYSVKGNNRYGVEINDKTYETRLIENRGGERNQSSLDVSDLVLEIDEVRDVFTVAIDRDCYVHHPETGTVRFSYRFLERTEAPLEKNLYIAPMSAKVVRVMVEVGESVKKGQNLMILETMKMESFIKADLPGTIIEISVAEDQQIEAGQPLLRLE